MSYKLETGSLVQFGDPVQYGVITKIETEVDTSRQVAEVETVSYEYIDITIYLLIASS